MDEKVKTVIDFIDFCIERDDRYKQVLELMFRHWVKDQLEAEKKSKQKEIT